MLNPEYVDWVNGNVKIGFTDEDAEQVLEIILQESDGFKLHKMLLEKTNMIAKNNRMVKE